MNCEQVFSKREKWKQCIRVQFAINQHFGSRSVARQFRVRFRKFSAVRSNMFVDCKIQRNCCRNDPSPNPFADKWLNLKAEDHRTNLLAIRSIGVLYGRYFHRFRTKSPRPLHYVGDWVIYFPLIWD